MLERFRARHAEAKRQEALRMEQKVLRKSGPGCQILRFRGTRRDADLLLLLPGWEVEDIQKEQIFGIHTEVSLRKVVAA